MRWKYQLRGLGLGLVLATLIMGIGQNKNEDVVTKPTATVESENTIEDYSSSEEVSEETVSEEMVSSEETVSEGIASEEVISSEETVEEEMVSEKETSEEAADPEYSVVVIEIRSGEGSGTVSKRLQEAGLIEDAVAYDKYLCRNGYDKKIRVGLHVVNTGATEEEIAKAITSK